jgi:ribosomal protein L34E
MARHGSIAEQLVAIKQRPVAANDNIPQRKPREPHYRGTLPALRWLWDNHPDLAQAFADALPRRSTDWFVDVEPTRQEIRPTIGELMKASHDEDGNQLSPIYETERRVSIGALRFLSGRLIEWGMTRKGKKLKPTDRPRSTESKENKTRSPLFYLATKATTPSPMAAEHYHRPLSGQPVLASMYDPLPGVEAARAVLSFLGVDGGVKASQLPYGVTLCPTVVADGAIFLGGVSNPSGNSSSGALMWDQPDAPTSNATVVIEEVAARGTLKSIGLLLGHDEGSAIAAGKSALIGIAEILSSIRNRKNLRAA